MARYNANGYQYETSPRKLQPEYTPIKKQYPKKSTASKKIVNAQKQVKAVQSKNNIKIMLYIGIIFAMLFAISYRNALIAQTYSQVQSLKAELSQVEKGNEQLEVTIDSKTNFSAIEKRATEELGMKKVNDSQTVYVSLDKKDYIESSADSVKLEEELNWFEKIVSKIQEIF